MNIANYPRSNVLRNNTNASRTAQIHREDPFHLLRKIVKTNVITLKFLSLFLLAHDSIPVIWSRQKGKHTLHMITSNNSEARCADELHPFGIHLSIYRLYPIGTHPSYSGDLGWSLGLTHEMRCHVDARGGNFLLGVVLEYAHQVASHAPGHNADNVGKIAVVKGKAEVSREDVCSHHRSCRDPGHPWSVGVHDTVVEVWTGLCGEEDRPAGRAIVVGPKPGDYA